MRTTYTTPAGRNVRGGSCARCGASVKAREGIMLNTGNRRVVAHAPGQCRVAAS